MAGGGENVRASVLAERIASVNSWIDLLIPGLEAVAAVVGAVLALGQLTLTARWRRAAQYWHEIAAADGAGQDRDTARRLSREARATLTALHLVPVRELVVAAAITGFGLVGVMLFSARLGSVPAGGRTLTAMLHSDPWACGAALILVVFIWHGLARWTDVLYERRRIAQDYLFGQPLHRESLGASGGGQARKARGWGMTALQGAIAAGSWCLASVYGLAWGISAQGASQAPAVVSQVLLVGMTCLGASLLIYQALPERAPYKHPATTEIAPCTR